MTEQSKEYKFGYFSRHKYQDLVFYVVNKDGQTNTGLFEMPDTPENKELMGALIPRPVSTLPEGAAPELEWKPSPPGDTISDIMEERGISRFKLGCLLKLREQSVSDLLSGNCPIDNDMAFRLSEVLGSTPDFWDNREQIYRRELRESTNDYHDAAIAQEAREEVLPLVDAAQKTQAELFHACWDKNLIDCVKQLGSDLRAIERSLRHPRKGVPE